MRLLVTGCAGFIGSHVVERLLADGHSVVGVDCLTDHYSPSTKLSNVATAQSDPAYRLLRLDLLTADLAPLLADVDVVVHLAGQPGVRLSWQSGFSVYVERNLLTSQRLLEAALSGGRPPRFVMASSSSVYGQALAYPVAEGDPTTPFSPYGVTKLAMESLSAAYAANWGLSIVALRYFTVYGPRQRPDMAMNIFVEAALAGDPLVVYGDGTQVRDFTYVADVVDATVRAAERSRPGMQVMNVAGGSAATVNDVLQLVSVATGRPLRLEHRPAQAGDVQRTGGSTELARDLLGWQPRTPLDEGVQRQVDWHLSAREAAG